MALVKMAFDLLQFLNVLGPEIWRLVSISIIGIAIAVAYKILSRSLFRLARSLEFDPHIENSLRLVLRVLTIIAATAALFAIFELPATLFIGGSALIGAAFGFGSSQTINNIVAGFYVVVSRPFKVKDYVRIGDAEGQVEEITINYTKLYTPSFNLLLVPNVQVMNSRVLNCTHEGFIKYTFSLSVPHGIPNEEVVSRCIEPAIEEFHGKYSDKQLRKPEFYFETSTNFGRTFKFRIFVPKGEAKTLFVLQSELSDMIINKWDMKRKEATG